MELNKLLIAATLGSVLTACGGSDNNDAPKPPTPPPPPATITLEGKVADGYLVGARVCVDLNENKVCDDGEPSATTGAGGSFSITDATQQQLDTYPLVVEVTAGTVDEDTGEAITRGYTLSAPAGYEFISPLTTMVQGEMEQGSSEEDAEAAIKALLGTTISLTQDYVAAQNDDSLSNEQKAEYLQLHQVAQVTARVIANNLAQIQAAADAAGISADDLIALIVDTVVNALETIVAQVEAAKDAGADFDPDAIAGSEEVESEASVSDDNLEEQIEVLHAEASAAAANLVTEVSGDGIFWFDGDYDADGLWLEYGHVKYDATNQKTIDVHYELVNGEFVAHNNSEFGTDDFILTDTGWQATTEESVITALNDDGTITLSHPDFPQLAETISAKEYALSGLSIKVLLAKQDNTWPWHKVMPVDASFSEGAKAFAIEVKTASDQYRLYYWDGCNEGDMVGGYCNSVWSRMAGGSEGPATSLSALISATASDGTLANLVGPYIAWHGDMQILAELIQGGMAKYHTVYWGQSSTGEAQRSVMLYATGEWRQVTQSGQTLILMTLPDDVRHFGEHEDDGELLLAVHQGAVRRGEFIPAGTGDDDEVIFNLAAKNDILTKLDLSLMPGSGGGDGPHTGFVCDTGDSEWDDSSNSPVTGTLKSLTQYRTLVSECRNGMAAMAFTSDMLVGFEFKEYDSDGTLETVIRFNSEGGNFTDYHEEPAETTAFTWNINDMGEVVVEVDDGNGGVAMRAYLSIVGKDGDYYSIKGYSEEAEWSQMDGSAGEVWSDKWQRMAQAN
ncbi:hypothetical protein [Shewanella litorisediminis]|uniref:Lipoprotein n=1 Tax=Shewanella litorisediminis TaxID=1173586 RepID=A0ABX7G4C8_9GAMM|nr:hypothetical protein [Shewanella litorisediminis]MCL2920110.1 hypothetical protein [Shewanella litorisediminis]QRH02107.1 hypothetical protein JQC75_01360 [Shewanella litorisediminis]